MEKNDLPLALGSWRGSFFCPTDYPRPAWILEIRNIRLRNHHGARAHFTWVKWIDKFAFSRINYIALRHGDIHGLDFWEG